MNFENLLSNIYTVLSKVIDQDYENVFIDNYEVTKELYDRSGLSGATFVVADSRQQCFVLLQSGVPEAENYKVKLQLPIRKASEASNRVTDSAYSRYCNRIFQIQRKSQGLGNYQHRLQLSSEPEFLGGLPTVFKWEPEKSDDWIYVPANEMFRGLLAWRWINWLIAEHGPQARLDDIDPEIAWSRQENWTANFELYFDAKYLGMFDSSITDDLPELFVAKLDFDEDAWNKTGEQAAKVWQALRARVDGLAKNERDFSEEFQRLSRLYKPYAGSAFDLGASDQSIVAGVHSWLKTEIAVSGATLEMALVCLHAQVNFPIPSYYYFSIEDSVAKEHLVVPVLRSDTSPLVYFVKGERKSHTAVVCGLASLNARTVKPEEQRMRILELKTVLRICADRIIDAIFIKGLVAAERERSKEKAINILSTCRAAPDDKRFVLGSFGRRVTFLAQQSRALMLVRALEEKGFLKAVRDTTDKAIAVVGGGLAGMTAAAALATLGVRVKLFESRDELLSLQAGATHRFIHPKMSTWPANGSLLDSANLPLMGWSAGLAPEVVKELREAFDSIKRETGLIDVNVNSRITNVEMSGSSVRVFDEGRFATGLDFPLAILAIGFGLESTVADGTPNVSYWEPDALEERKVTKRDVLVIGDGDGGLIDLARAALNTLDSKGNQVPFNHETLVRELMESSPFEELALGIKNCDENPLRSPDVPRPYDLYRKAFDAINVKGRLELRERLLRLKRNDTTVHYGFSNEQVFRTDTALINRVLAFLIFETKCASPFYLGRAKEVKMTDVGKYVVFDKDNRQRTFDYVMARVGTNPRWLAEQIPSMSKAAEDLGGLLREFEIADELDAYTYDWYIEQKESHKPR